MKSLFITDTFSNLNVKKDTSILMMEEVMHLGNNAHQCEINDLFIKKGLVYSTASEIISTNKLGEKSEIALREFQYVFMRKDPPVDENFINALHLLSLAENQGTKVFNNPNSIKQFNEKIFALYFEEFIPNTFISSNISKIKDFMTNNTSTIVKPFDGMGGSSIYKLDDANQDSLKILEKLTSNEKTLIIAQEFLDEIYEGDVRVLIINGKPFRKTLARIPQDGNFKGNLAAGGKGLVRDITKDQQYIAEEIGKYLMKKGINFAGIDVIGDRLTEINITSPTCAREILDQSGENPVKEYFKGL
ncbi:MAG: glutathione synthase [Gammaproteobacteria bacterium]